MMILALTLFVLLSDSSAIQLFPSDPGQPVNYDSLANSFATRFKSITTPESEHRKQMRLAVQRQGYTNSLMDAISGDGLGAMLSYLKMVLHLEYSLPHTPVYVQFAIPQTGRPVPFPVPENRQFPDDPWKK